MSKNKKKDLFDAFDDLFDDDSTLASVEMSEIDKWE